MTDQFDAYMDRVLNGKTYMFCPNHKRLERALKYVPSKGYRLACRCVRTTAIGRPEPSPEFLFAPREAFASTITKEQGAKAF